MSRYASLCIRDFPVVALRRAEPELRGVSLLLTRSGQTPQPESRILCCSAEAVARGASAGMTVAQAMARSSDFLLRPMDPEILHAARESFFEGVFTVVPHVELAPLSEQSAQAVYLEVPEAGGRFRSTGGLASALLSRLTPGGFLPAVGLADRLATAIVAAEEAASHPGEVVLIPPGGDREWLAERPLALLHPDSEIQAWLEGVGIEYLGQLAAIPRDQVATRLGREGVRLWEQACGIFSRPLRRRFPKVDLLEGVTLEWGVDSLQALLFVLRGLLERLLVRLELRSMAVAAMRLRLEATDGTVQERPMGVLAATREHKVLLEVLRLELERHPPDAAIAKVSLVFVPEEARPEQLDLFRPAGPPPLRLATTLARLASICGEGRVGRPLAPQGYRPEPSVLATFAPVHRPDTGGTRGWEMAREKPATFLRLLRPALRIEIVGNGRIFSALLRNGVSCAIVRMGGPWRIEVEWWAEKPCCRDYYDVELRNGGFCRIYQDLNAPEERSGWFMSGIYD